jgi:hypothetical protein
MIVWGSALGQKSPTREVWPIGSLEKEATYLNVLDDFMQKEQIL